MVDATTTFFEDLGRRGHEPRLSKATGRIRFELRDGNRTQRWLVDIKKGDVAVSRNNGDADCIVRADRTTFDQVVTGEANAMAMILRGLLMAEGQPELVVLFQRLFPGPPRHEKARRAAGYARKQS